MLKLIANLRFTCQPRKSCGAIIPVRRRNFLSLPVCITIMLPTKDAGIGTGKTIMSMNISGKALVALLVAYVFCAVAYAQKSGGNVYTHGGITRLNPEERKVALVFTAADMADGADTVMSTLKRYRVRGHFFFTGGFFGKFPDVVRRLLKDGHYVGCHGYSHLLYLPWDRSDTMLVSRTAFREDINKAYDTMAPFGIRKKKAYYFIPPYEHFNDTVSAWALEMGLQLINNTQGTLTYGDYTTPDMARYYSSDCIMERTMRMAAEKPDGINGHILLIHLGTSERRTDKFYNRLPQLIEGLRGMGYEFADLSKVIPKP